MHTLTLYVVHTLIHGYSNFYKYALINKSGNVAYILNVYKHIYPQPFIELRPHLAKHHPQSVRKLSSSPKTSTLTIAPSPPLPNKIQKPKRDKKNIHITCTYITHTYPNIYIQCIHLHT